MKHTTRARRLAAAGTAAALAIGLTSGCTATSGGADGSTEITFSYLWAGPEAEVLEGLIEEFNGSQDEVVVTGVSSPDTAAQLTALSGSRPQFDVSDHFGDSVGTWVDQGLLADLTPFIERDGFDVDDFVPSSLEPLTVDGNVYSLPIATYTYQLMYNKTLLAEAGLDVPTTFEELVAAGKALTQVEGGAVTRLGFAPLDLKTMTWAAGGEWVQDGVPAPDADAVSAAANLYLEQTEDVDPSAAQSFVASFGDYWSENNPFFTGQVAMTIDGPWFVAMTKQYAPELDWGVANIPVPADHPEIAGTAPLNISTLFIANNSEKKDAAWEFVKFLMSPDSLATFNRQLTNIAPRYSLAQDPTLAELGENYLAFVDSLNTGTLKTMPAAPWTVEYGTLIFETQNDIYQGVSSPADAIDRLVAEAAEIAP